MSKSLKKLIDINRLREFKNKLVGTDSAYVQTGAVDQTIAGTKTFSKPIAGSVTGSSGSCTGNAATATKATQDSDGNKITTTYSKNGHTHDDRYYTETEVNNLLKGKANDSDVVHKSGNETIVGTKTFNDDVHANGFHSTTPNGFMAQYGGYTLVLRNDGSNTYLLMSDKDGVPGTWSSARPFVISNSTGVCDINGNAATATKLAAKRTIALSGAATGTATGFDGSGNITIPVTSLDASAIRAHILSMVYPVGSVYISVNNVSPEKFLGGKWIKISQGRVLQGASGTQTAGTEVSAGLPNISVSSNGEHTHTRGSMNITGTVTMHGIGSCTVINSVAGAFYGSGTESSYQGTYCASGAPSERLINFSADRTWTGSTSSDGAHSHSAYITGITGNSTTVQPPALLVNIWKRTA